MAIITQNERDYLLDSMRDLLDEYDYEYTESALNKIIDEWESNKGNLIELFKKHPNYVEGKFMIAFNADFERKINIEPSNDFSKYIRNVAELLRNDIPKEIADKRDEEGCWLLPDKLYSFFRNLDMFAERTISDGTADLLNEICPAAHAHSGQKTSRVVNKICTYLGYSKHKDYNREYAKYADSLSPLALKRHTVLSLNPLDYLTMSFGNSWASCHTIDKTNKRGMPNSYSGAYSSGTMSYMLDGTSMVMYVISYDYNGDNYWDAPKINRQMFHFGEDKLVQGRLYPQDNDCDGSVYTPYRNIAQKIMADILGIPNLWTMKKGSGAASNYINSHGTHYRDYQYYSNCTLSTIKGSENENYIKVGHDPICIECGYTHSNCESINCCSDGARYCEDCGCRIDDEDDMFWVNGECYCRDCVSWCESCQEYHRTEEYFIDRDQIYVCEYCYNEYYVCCEDCDETLHRDDAYYIDSEDRWVCGSCLNENYFECEQCETYHNRNNMHEYDGEYLCEDCYDRATENEEETVAV